MSAAVADTPPAPTATATTAATPTRDRIVAVASQLFVDQGYDATSLREISEALGFTKAALYYHFKSKDEILGAALLPAFELQRALVERISRIETMEDWADVLAWTIDRFFEHRLVFDLMHRSRASVESLAESSAFFEDHERLHQQIEASLSRIDLPLSQRIRLVCAFGAIVTFDDFGGPLLEEPEDVVRAELVAVVRDILRLDPAPS